MSVVNSIVLTEELLLQQTNEIADFLSLVHPGLLDGSYLENKVCVEIRPILRVNGEYRLSRSLNLWDLSTKSLDKLYNFLSTRNGVPCCLYYSVFAFNYDMAFTVSKSGAKMRKGKVNSEAAVFTNEVVLDFDNVDFDEYTRLAESFEKNGLSATWVNSGHGYQAHFIFDAVNYDKDVLKKLVFKFRSKGYNADVACIDPARVMRLPYTYNCKCFTDEKYAHELNNPPFTEITSVSKEQYSVEELMHLLDGLETVSDMDERAFFNALSAKPPDHLYNELLPPEWLNTNLVEMKGLDYPHLQNISLPEPISKMLLNCPKGLRNKAFGFLTNYFKYYLKMGKQQTLEIMQLWSVNACTPAYDEETFDYDFKRFFYKGGLPYDSQLAKEFGYIDFQAEIEIRKKDIYVPLQFLQEMKDLSGPQVRLYLAIKMLEHIEKPTTKANLMELLKVTKSPFDTALSGIKKSGHVFVKNGNKRLGIPSTYHSSKIISRTAGYCSFSFNDIKAYLEELSIGEIKLILFMKYKFNNGDIFMSQENMGKSIGLKQNTVSVVADGLRDKYFLKITKKMVSSKGLYSCIYTILR